MRARRGGAPGPKGLCRPAGWVPRMRQLYEKSRQRIKKSDSGAALGRQQAGARGAASDGRAALPQTSQRRSDAAPHTRTRNRVVGLSARETHPPLLFIVTDVHASSKPRARAAWLRMAAHACGSLSLLPLNFTHFTLIHLPKASPHTATAPPPTDLSHPLHPQSPTPPPYQHTTGGARAPRTG